LSYPPRVPKYFVCKKVKQLFELDLDAGTYTRQSTTSGLFDGGPDQLQRILLGGKQDYLFFTEEGKLVQSGWCPLSRADVSQRVVITGGKGRYCTTDDKSLGLMQL
jgi:hypothetical protein